MSGEHRVRYAHLKDADVAFQVRGQGPPDLLFIPGQLNHLESVTSVPALAEHCDRLARFARVVLYDKRGTGLSGPLDGSPTIEERVDEAVAVLDAVGSEHTAVYATADGGPVGLVLAAMHPARVQHLAVGGSSARLLTAPGYPEGLAPELMSPEVLREEFARWGDDDDPAALALIAPSHADDPVVRRALAAMERLAGTPRAAQRYWQVVVETDVRDVLPLVRAETSVIHSRGDRLFPIEQGRYLARSIPDATLIELPTDDHFYFWENGGRVARRVTDLLEVLVTGSRSAHEPDRSFAIILFTDIVDSTRTVSELGDGAWRDLLDRHDRIASKLIAEHGGQLIKSTGDGMLVTFDGPSRALRCASRLVDSMSSEALDIRAGVHAGEVEWRHGDVAGIAVHIASRICALARGSEVLTTSTLKDLTAGSGIEFIEKGQRELKGVPGSWSVLAAVG